ncbi:MAG: hypothetical protein E7462_05525 [Ruminococcaceae bacterium]|nr:hypothetical protein [Oscillospiraceae bacterium]
MSKVVFITPNLTRSVREEPVGTLLLATILRNNGIDASILQFYDFGDMSSFDVFLDNAIRSISELRPKIISFYTRCDTYHISLKLAAQLKHTLPGAYIVFGGPQADISATQTLNAFPYVDFICCGEGENVVTPFFTSLLANQPDLSTPGLVSGRTPLLSQIRAPCS